MSPQPNNKIDTAIEEWPENQTFASAWRLAPAEPTPKEVEVNNSLSAKDLKSLKKRDPFLYYSIPGVRDAAILQMGHDDDVDMHQVAQNGLQRHCQTCPATMETSCTSQPVTKVKRCTRVSFECHGDLLIDLDELVKDFAGMDVEKGLADDPFDSLFKLLESS